MRAARLVRRLLHAAPPLPSAPCQPAVPAARCFSSAAAAAAASPPLPPARTAVLFPGQGSQRVGSSVRSLEDEWGSIVRPVWQELDETLKMHLSRTMKDGLMVLRSCLGLKDLSSLCCVTLGHSLGEYTALLAAGSIDFATAVRLVHARGRAMKHATREGEGGMLALLCDSQATSLHLPSIEELVEEARAATERPIQLANLNSPFQVVLSGHRDALAHVKQRVNHKNSQQQQQQRQQEHGSQSRGNENSGGGSAAASDAPSLTRGILKAVSLDVSGPFHSSMMQPAARPLAEALSFVQFARPSVPVIFNVHAHPSVQHAKFAGYLQQQLLSPVLWHPSIVHALLRLNVSHFLELGPSTPLSTMLRSAAARLERQGGVLDPSLHPADAAAQARRSNADAVVPHPSILPLMLPRPRVVLDDGTRTHDKDSQAILAGSPHAWGQLSAVGVSSVEEMRALLARQEQPISTPT